MKQMTGGRTVKTADRRTRRPGRATLGLLVPGFGISLTGWVFSSSEAAGAMLPGVLAAEERLGGVLFIEGAIAATCAVSVFLARLAGAVAGYGLVAAALGLFLVDAEIGRLAL